MKLTYPLSPWTTWVLRIAVLLALAVGVFSAQCSSNSTRGILEQYEVRRIVGSCSIDAYTKIRLRDGALPYRDALSACLQKEDLTFDDLGEPLSELLSRLPANPERYAGIWKSRRANCENRITLLENGFYSTEPVLCETSTRSEQGIWAVLDGKMVLIPVPGGPREVVTKPISIVDDENFIASENDGSSTLFSKASGSAPSLAVDAVITIVPPDEQGRVAGQMAAANRDRNDPPTLPEATPISVSNSSEVLWRRNIDGAIMRWDPATGLLQVLPIDPAAWNVNLAAAATDDGLLLFRTYLENLIPTRTEVLFVSTDNNAVSRAELAVPRIDLTLVTLADQSVLIVGGTVWQQRTDYDNRKKKRTNAVEQVTWANGQLQVGEIAAMPGDIRYGYSMVALKDGRAMLLGGGTSYIGHPVSDETLFLDVAANTWESGPTMLQPRSGASATLMPNGSVLIAGGWTPGKGWSDGASRSTEVWDPRSNSFSSGKRLPMGIANHQAKWTRNDDRNALLLVGGWLGAWANNSLVTTYDIERDVWVTAIEQCAASGKTRTVAVPFEFNDRSLMWCPSTKSSQEPWQLVHLTPNVAGSVHLDPADGMALGRGSISFLPPDGASPGLAVGGYFEGFDSASVDAVWQDGRLLSIAPLNQARRNAQVFRLIDGSFIVAGGLAGSSSRRTEHVPPMELLPAGVPITSARWQEINYSMAGVAGIASLSDDSLLVVHSSGEVDRLTISYADGEPVVERHAFPSLNHKRNSSQRRYDSQIVVRELTDGRIIVAGGNVQHHRIALLHDEVFAAGAADRYVDVGEFSAARFYEIYDPQLGRWRESAFSTGASRSAAVLDDGRVVTWSKHEASDYWEQANRYSDNERIPTLLEISSADGLHWKRLKTRVPPSAAIDLAHESVELFVIQNELFLTGMHVPDDGARVAGVEWFNADRNEWVTLWQAGPGENWSRYHLGRTVIRDLPNGKRIVLPVAGLFGRGGG